MLFTICVNGMRPSSATIANSIAQRTARTAAQRKTNLKWS
jgi:hypothetical protein